MIRDLERIEYFREMLRKRDETLTKLCSRQTTKESEPSTESSYVRWRRLGKANYGVDCRY